MDFNNGKYLDELFATLFITIENNGIINALASAPNSSNANGAHDQKLKLFVTLVKLWHFKEKLKIIICLLQLTFSKTYICKLSFEIPKTTLPSPRCFCVNNGAPIDLIDVKAMPCIVCYNVVVKVFQCLLKKSVLKGVDYVWEVNDIIAMRKFIDLWMSMGAYDVFALWSIFWVQIGSPNASQLGCSRLLKQLGRPWNWKDEGFTLGTMTTMLSLGLEKAFQGTCFEHGNVEQHMNRRCFLICMKCWSSLPNAIFKSIFWPKKSKKRHQEWAKDICQSMSQCKFVNTKIANSH